MITLAIPTIRRFDCLQNCVDSAMRGTRKPDRILIIDNSCGHIQYHQHDYPTYTHTPERNLGCAGSWNFFFKTSDDHIIISNDDVIFHENAIEQLYQKAVDEPEIGFIAAGGANAFSCFLMRKWAWAKICGFDERFYPAYFEDNHAGRMMQIMNIPVFFFPSLYHHVGSATLQTANPQEKQAHHASFAQNQAYYIELWGGLPHQERFSTPFNRPLEDYLEQKRAT